MTHKLPDTPSLASPPVAATLIGLHNFARALHRSLDAVLSGLSYQVNRVLSLDGTDTMTGGLVLLTVTVSTLPSAATAGAWVYVSDETGGAVPAFSDGTAWRRCTDRVVVS